MEQSMTFARSTWVKPPLLRDQDRPPQRLYREVSFEGGVSGRALAKAPEPVRDESYRRWVASLPCYECGIEGYSQAAHANSGKAKGRKTSDLTCFPLCCSRPLVPGCHFLFDQFILVRREEMPEYERAALAWTRAQGAKGYWDALGAAIAATPRLPDQDISGDPPAGI
jgi:hypothetical protein